MSFTKYTINVQPRDPWVDVLVGELSLLDFDSFEEQEFGLQAYIDTSLITSDLDLFFKQFKNREGLERVTVESEVLPDVNWNAKWEEDYPPVVVHDFCTIKAVFHEFVPVTRHVIEITPQMSFGTGHHPTTFMMVEAMSTFDFTGKSVLDMGAGTAVLGILACQLQAKNVIGVEIEPWAVDNARDNVRRNKVQIEIREGGKEMIGDDQFDVILANINRNILLDQLKDYQKGLNKNGSLLMSGFMKEDATLLERSCVNLGFSLVSKLEKDNWICLVFRRR